MIHNKAITVVTPFYYPEDTAIGLYTTQFSEYLIKKGVEVTVITGFPNYPEWKIHKAYNNLPNYYTEDFNGIKIIRYKQYVPEKVNFKGRVLLMLSLFYGVFRNISKIKKTDLVICILPFSINILPSWYLSKKLKAKLWVHVQDFEFDLVLDSGVVKNNNLFFKLIKKTLVVFERKMLNLASIVSSISFSMLDKVRLKSSHQDPFYFPNWVSSEKINPSRSSKHKLINSSKFTLLYSGNIGEKQNWTFLENLCTMVAISDDIEIVVVGDGAYKNKLKEQLNNFSFVKFSDPVPYEELNDLLCSANVHFLFQKNEVVDTVMPSKILAMMASSKPSIITGNINSEVASVINQSNGGFYFSDNSAKTVYEKLLELKNNNEICLQTGINARKYVLKSFSEELILNSLHEKICEILK